MFGNVNHVSSPNDLIHRSLDSHLMIFLASQEPYTTQHSESHERNLSIHQIWCFNLITIATKSMGMGGSNTEFRLTIINPHFDRSPRSDRAFRLQHVLCIMRLLSRESLITDLKEFYCSLSSSSADAGAAGEMAR